ncbi:hypothetical protein XENOCAPTIV_024903, partial [Xenoophorus captivus]
KEPKAGSSSDSKRDIIGGREEDEAYAKVYSKDGTEIDLTKNSLPSGGKYEKVNGLKAAGSGGVAMGEVACRSIATLNRLTPYGSEAPPPYEWMLSLSVEDMVRDLEERLVEKEHELKQMRRNLDESEGAIAQVFEGKQRLWEKEVEELKRLYAAKLRQVSQHAQRSQRSLQLELFRSQQEKNHLQEELDSLKSQEATAVPKPTSPTLEETQWEVRVQENIPAA